MTDVENFADELTFNEEDKSQKVNAYRKKKVEVHHCWATKSYHVMPGTRSDIAMPSLQKSIMRLSF